MSKRGARRREHFLGSFGFTLLVAGITELMSLNPSPKSDEGKLLAVLAAALNEYQDGKAPDELAKSQRNARRVGSMHGDKNR